MSGQKQHQGGSEKPQNENAGLSPKAQPTDEAVNFVEKLESTAQTVNLVYGAHDLDVEVTGLTVAEVQLAYKDIINVEDDAEAYVNGKPVVDKNSISLNAGDRLQFMKEAGQKGSLGN